MKEFVLTQPYLSVDEMISSGEVAVYKDELQNCGDELYAIVSRTGKRYDLFGNVVNDTGRLYTSYGNGPNDGRILSRSYTYTDSIIPNPRKTQFRYGFDWVPDGSGIWPVNVPPVTQ